MLGAWLRSSVRWSGRGSRSPGGDCRRSQPRPEARGAGSDHPPFGRPAERRGGRQARRGRPAGGVALAAAVRPGRGRQPLVRRHPQARQASAGRCHRASRGGADLHRAAGRGNPLDRPGHGEDGRDLLALGTADSGRLGHARRRPAHGPRSSRSSPTSGSRSTSTSARNQWMYESMDASNDGLMNAYKWKIASDPAVLGHDEVIATLARAVHKYAAYDLHRLSLRQHHFRPDNAGGDARRVAEPLRGYRGPVRRDLAYSAVHADVLREVSGPPAVRDRHGHRGRDVPGHVPASSRPRTSTSISRPCGCITGRITASACPTASCGSSIGTTRARC